MGVYEDCSSLNGRIAKELKSCEAQLQRMSSGVATTLDPKAELGGGTVGTEMLARCIALTSLFKPYRKFTSKYWNELKGNSTRARIRKAEKRLEKMEKEVLAVSQDIYDNAQTYVDVVKAGSVDQATHMQISESISKSGGNFYRWSKSMEIDSETMRKARGLMKKSRKLFKSVKVKK